jgi:hypothetical protein
MTEKTAYSGASLLLLFIKYHNGGGGGTNRRKIGTCMGDLFYLEILKERDHSGDEKNIS